mmetsp:Transcript_50072/g.119121  ORF Transcript_50072/g.119121 Transcript_50072/m.119121 type:complete len:224 (-) Transcript_50072:422-1093(-)
MRVGPLLVVHRCLRVPHDGDGPGARPLHGAGAPAQPLHGQAPGSPRDQAPCARVHGDAVGPPGGAPGRGHLEVRVAVDPEGHFDAQRRLAHHRRPLPQGGAARVPLAAVADAQERGLHHGRRHHDHGRDRQRDVPPRARDRGRDLRRQHHGHRLARPGRLVRRNRSSPGDDPHSDDQGAHGRHALRSRPKRLQDSLQALPHGGEGATEGDQHHDHNFQAPFVC